MLTPADELVVEESVTIEAPAREVWHALVDGAARAGWWAYLDLDARPGGRFEERWTDADGRLIRTHGRVTELAEGRLLRLSWADEDWSEATEVEVRVQDAGHGVSVHVRHTGWERLPDGAALAAAHRSGWGMHLADLRRYLEEPAGP